MSAPEGVDPTPVPLDEIEAAHAWDRLDPDEPRCRRCDLPFPCRPVALCEALRIAVEGLDLIAADETGCCYEWWDTTCAKRGDPEPCHFCIVNERRAAVRELVDLGGDDGP